jgi:hypothetical protein
LKNASRLHLKLRDFFDRLGRYSYRGAESRQLTLPEMACLVVMAGRLVGFHVETEVRCGRRGRIDCVWFRNAKKTAAVVWEFDALDVAKAHLTGSKKSTSKQTPRRPRPKRYGTFQKLRYFRRAIKVQALYAIRGEVKKKKGYLSSESFQRQLKSPSEILLCTDQMLLKGDLKLILKAAQGKKTTGSVRLGERGR